MSKFEKGSGKLGPSKRVWEGYNNFGPSEPESQSDMFIEFTQKV